MIEGREGREAVIRRRCLGCPLQVLAGLQRRLRSALQSGLFYSGGRLPAVATLT